MRGIYFFLFTLFSYATFAQADTCLVEVNDHIPGILLDIRYATENNFTGKKVYPSARCFLRYSVVKALSKVQKELQSMGLQLIIFDGYRPRSVQYIFWEIMPDERYVLNPKKGSRHNRGAAVDLTLADLNGKPLKMPSEYDDFSEKAHVNYQNCDNESKKNRDLLQNIMTKNGFHSFETEWWHFDFTGWERFPLLDVPFEKVKDICN